MTDDQDLMTALGQRIVSRRGTLGLTQEELAALVHVSVRTISAYERGRARRDPRLFAILEFALNWGSDSIVNILAGGEADTFEESNGGYLWDRLPADFKEAPAGRKDAWRSAWRKKEAYQEAYETAALEQDHSKKAAARTV